MVRLVRLASVAAGAALAVFCTTPASTGRVSAAILAPPAVVRAAAAPQLTTIDGPGAHLTSVSAINDPGALVGSFIRTGDSVGHGFGRLPDGRTFAFDPPVGAFGLIFTNPIGIDNQFDVVGFFTDRGGVCCGVNHAFVRSRTGAYDVFEVPNAALVDNEGTEALGVNASLETAGVFWDATMGGRRRGFVRSAAGAVVAFDAPGSVATDVCSANCLNDAGTVAGTYTDSKGITHGFVRSASGSITTFDPPGAATGCLVGGTVVTSIDAEGVTTGFFSNACSTSRGFIRTSTGAFATFDAPGLTQTIPSSINAVGDVVGTGFTTAGIEVMFVRSAAGAIRVVSLPTGVQSVSNLLRNNRAGTVAGTYQDARLNTERGFLVLPGTGL